MDTHRRLGTLSADQALHERVMHAVILRMQDTPYVLKGGTALALLYGLDRHSTDIDFDAADPMHIKDRVRNGLADANVEMSAFITARDRPSGQRFKVHYIDPGSSEDRLMNVDTSFRTAPNEDDVAVVREIRTYRIESLFDQKLRAANHRTVGRDLYDLAFIADRYGNRLSSEQIREAEAFSHDYEGLAGRFDQAFREEPSLASLSTADERALVLRIAVEGQIAKRRRTVMEQATPRDLPRARAPALHGIRLESAGT